MKQYRRQGQQRPAAIARCHKCGSSMTENLLPQHERNCKVRRQQPPRVQQQQQRQYRNNQGQTNTQSPADPWANFHQNFQWVNQPFFQQQTEESSDEEQPQGFQYSCQMYGDQMPGNIQIQFQSIFGPNGTFTQSMNQMSSMMQNVQFQVNTNGNQRNVIRINAPNIQVNQQVYYNDEDEEEEEEDAYEEEEEEETAPGLQEEQIQEMPQSYFRGTETNVRHCVVCMTDFKRGEKLRTLRCLHSFHSDCVDNWLRLKGDCPICRFAQ